MTATENRTPPQRGPIAAAFDEGVQRILRIGKRLHSRGEPLGDYFSGVTAADVRTQRDTKTTLAQRLKDSRVHPQFVTVRGRGGDADSQYVILPVDRVAELLEAKVEDLDESFVPITRRMRDCDGGAGEVMAPKPRDLGTRGGRPRRRPMPVPPVSKDA